MPTAVLLIIGGLLCWWKYGFEPNRDEKSAIFLGKEFEGEVSPSNRSDEVAIRQRKIRDAFSTPINFWGKVVDLEGNPVGGAVADLSVSTGPLSHSGASSFRLESGPEGLFELLGKRGAEVGVTVKKEGYERVFSRDPGSPSSGRRFNYFDANVVQSVAPPSAASPAVFVLRKKLDAEIINRGDKKRHSLPIGGAPVFVGLTLGGEEVRFRCVASPEKRYGEGRNAPFDWQCDISIPHGGIQVWADPNRVIAPEKGYLENVSVKMPGTLSPGDWRWAMSGLHYWCKLADGTYARIKVDIQVGRQNFIYVDSWHNPSGSRNLEHDPARENQI